jgi:hypothetical protein
LLDKIASHDFVGQDFSRVSQGFLFCFCFSYFSVVFSWKNWFVCEVKVSFTLSPWAGQMIERVWTLLGLVTGVPPLGLSSMARIQGSQILTWWLKDSRSTFWQTRQKLYGLALEITF